MDRAESRVIQVNPDYVNLKIQEMEAFGWSLQGQQDVHVQGEAQMTPSLLGGTYITTTKVNHYVKLHFVRSYNLQNLAEIKRLEDEYERLPFPPRPSTAGPGFLTFIGVITVLASLVGVIEGFGLVGALALFVGGIWFWSVSKTWSENLSVRKQSVRRGGEIMSSARALLS
jgi:hypothetical protein